MSFKEAKIKYSQQEIIDLFNSIADLPVEKQRFHINILERMEENNDLIDNLDRLMRKADKKLSNIERKLGIK